MTEIYPETVDELAEILSHDDNIDFMLLDLQRVIEPMVKTKTNPFYSSKYFDINALLEVVVPELNKFDILVTQPLKGDKVCTVLTHVPTGQWRESWLNIPAGLDAQKLGAAVTFLRRYTLLSLLSIQAEDDDGNGAVKSPAHTAIPEAPARQIASPVPGEGTAASVYKAPVLPVPDYAKHFQDNKRQPKTQTSNCDDCGAVTSKWSAKSSTWYCSAFCFKPENQHLQAEYAKRRQYAPAPVEPRQQMPDIMEIDKELSESIPF